MKIVIVTGGAGFVGSSLIEKLIILDKNIKIISLDNYSSGSKKNHIKSKRVKYISGDTTKFKNYFYKLRKKIITVFHFGEFSRIAQSFENQNKCFSSNLIGSYCVINFCLKHKIKIIYSATSATLGNEKNPNRSPYSFSKFQNLNLLINLRKWYGLNYSVIYFYNVYGDRQIKNHHMSAVVGIFETKYIQNKKLPVVVPGTQKRNFTHISDTIDCVIKVYQQKKSVHYAVFNKKFYSILNVAKMFTKNIEFVNARPGERFHSKIITKFRGVKINHFNAKKSLPQYIKDFKKSVDFKKNK